MKTIFQFMMMISCLILISCQGGEKTQDAGTAAVETQAADLGQAAVQDDDSQKDIVKIAIGSADHTTLVKALQQAEYVNDLANAGPFTVFAPVNAAFEKLPAGTVENLMKNEQKAALQNILEYHVALGVYRENMFRDGQTINMANTKNISIQLKDGKIMINNSANVVATVPASNGIIYVIDAVLLPPE
ncbi:MAG: fasciclin domain-containing protein [Saprospiraceae bacterium]|nr:fasciclin domain-containing protein [Saprospiraceae bacterium]